MRAGVGAAASQNITDPALGVRVLDLIAQGASASQAIGRITHSTADIEYRQLTAVDMTGETAGFSGRHTLGIHAICQARNAVCAGNLLASDQVPQAMLAAFTAAGGHLGERLLAALKAGRDAGGEAGPVHSAGMLVADKVSWPVTDLRVDWNEDGDPVGELEKLWRIYCTQIDDYVARAENPASAPGYGVPGDES